MSNQWKIQINDGPVQDFETKTSQYGLAAVAALAQLDYEESKLINDNKVVNFVKFGLNRFEQIFKNGSVCFFGCSHIFLLLGNQ